MPAKYLNVKEAAQVVGVGEDEIKQMLERRELHGYRDGADWKFKVEDIERIVKQRAAAPGSTVDRLGADEIERIAKQRAPQGSAPEGDEGDVLLSEVALGRGDTGASGTVIGMESTGKAAADSDIRLAGSDVHAAAEAPKPRGPDKAKAAGESKKAQFEELDLTLDQDLTLEDSNVASAATAGARPGDSAVDLSGKKLDDDDLVLGGSGTGSDITIGGDSGISLVDPADSGLSLEEPLNLGGGGGEESLELGEDDMLALSASQSSPSVKTDDDFQLTPMPETDADESESGSQVIALDTEGEGDEGVTMIAGGAAAMLDEDLSVESPPGFGMPAGDMALAGAPGGLMAGAPMMQPSIALPEAPYTIWNVAALIFCSLLLVFAGVMIVDLVAHQASYESTHYVGSPLLDTILGWFEK
ncbi:MAG: helix-turn-helix domain-containing protein [Thermoguttaceae bacterium]